jgi:hypothetical protein
MTSVNTQILHLRRKLETDPANPRYVRPGRGAATCLGYVLNLSADGRP